MSKARALAEKILKVWDVEDTRQEYLQRAEALLEPVLSAEWASGFFCGKRLCDKCLKELP